MFSRNIHIRKLGKISVFYAVITDLTFHVTLQDNVIKNSCDFVEGSSNVYPSTARLDGHRSFGSRDKVILVCLVISQKDMIKGSCEYLGPPQSLFHSCQVICP